MAKSGWGGQRQGAGRKPKSIRIGKRFTIADGQVVRVNSAWPDGVTMVREATVELGGGSRNRTIKLHCGDGETIVIAMLT